MGAIVNVEPVGMEEFAIAPVQAHVFVAGMGRHAAWIAPFDAESFVLAAVLRIAGPLDVSSHGGANV